MGRLERLQGRIEDARAHYEEAYTLLQKLVQQNGAYANEMGQIEAALTELQHIAPAQHASSPR